MINNYLVQQIKGNFLYKPTLEQEKAVKSLADFLFSRQQDSVFLLKGMPEPERRLSSGHWSRLWISCNRSVFCWLPPVEPQKYFHIMLNILLSRFIRRFTVSATILMTWTTSLWMTICISKLCSLSMRRR